MTWDNVATVQFTDQNGVVYNVKDIKPIDTFTPAFIHKMNENDDLDEIISRPEFFGADAENLAYSLIEANVEKFVENNFDTANIKTLNVVAV